MKVTNGHVKTKWLELDYQDVELDGRHLRYASTGPSSIKRVTSLLVKEPVTIAWMDSFAEGETMYDIGANLGMYTIYAAVMRKARVYAFEPEALNYAELNKNIYLNGLHDRVLAYCLALSDVDKTDRLLLSDFGYGISYHDFEENSWTGDKQFSPDWLVRKNERRPQGAIGRRLDSLVAEGLPVPAHIKIDVDGLEHRVVGGMLDLLRRPELRTVLIEVNFDEPKNLELIDLVCSLGWRFSWNQLRCHRKVKFTVEAIKRYQELRKGGLNYIFYRDSFYDRFFDEYFENYVPPLAGVSKRNPEPAITAGDPDVDNDISEPPAVLEGPDTDQRLLSQQSLADTRDAAAIPHSSPEGRNPRDAPAIPPRRTDAGEDVLWLHAVSKLEHVDGENRWDASRGPIRFELISGNPGFPEGWVLIRCRLSPNILDGSAQLAVETDSGQISLEVPVSSEGYVLELVELPPRVRKLEWRPSHRDGPFDHTPFLMRQVGAAERYWMMARRVVGYSLKHPPEQKARVGLSLRRSLFDLKGQYRACGKLRSHVQPPDKGRIDPSPTDDFRPE